MEISLGEYQLVHSGVVIQIDSMPIKIKLIDEIEGDFTFIFNFIQDNSEKKALTNFTPLDAHTMQVDLKNFNHFSNGGNSELVDVGTLKTKPLFISYRVFDLINIGKTFMFNFYTKEGDNNVK